MSKELTRAWKAGKLNDGLYYIRLEDDTTPIAELETWCRYNIDEHNELTQEFFGYPKNIISEVLSPIPSYSQFVELTEKVKELEKEIERKQRFINARNSPVYREETYRLQKASIDELTSLLKECDNELKILRMLSLPIASKEALAECDNLLIRIIATIGESED